MTIYQHGAPNPDTAEENYAPTPNRSGSISVTISNGEAVTEQRGNAKYQHGNLARDAYGDSWRGTARTPSGRSTADITRDTLVTVAGIEARVQDFVSMGALREVAAGQFEENTGDHGQAPEMQAVADINHDAPPLDNEVSAFMSDVLSPVPEHAVEPLMNAAAHAVATGRSTDAVAAQLATQVPGMSIEQGKMVIGLALKAHQDQADAYVTAPGRVAKEDLHGFHEYVRRDPSKMIQAIHQQRRGSMAGWRSLVDSYQTATPPTAAALAQAGFATRNTSGTPEVRINGAWVSVHGAARAGLL